MGEIQVDCERKKSMGRAWWKILRVTYGWKLMTFGTSRIFLAFWKRFKKLSQIVPKYLDNIVELFLGNIIRLLE